MHTSSEALAPLSMAERKRRLVRDQLGEVALHLVARQGYEETTVDQIVAAAGVSRRTFFRYFKSKEDIVVESVSDLGAAIRAELAARPTGEGPEAAVRAAFAVAAEQLTLEPEKALPLTRLMFDTPALHRRFLEHQSVLQEELAAELARREGLDVDEDLGPALVAGVALTAFQVAVEAWTRHNGDGDLNLLIDEAFSRTNPGAAARRRATEPG
ncbi:MAG TPA: TetR family transcriptional regulator [Actinocrinis sp.]|uniref:TetR family transcriptional regulator n=1 Tax=Actinocrinis sp. TaxID=1920516 RepID=UPI002DDDB37A|nr:TetR family transcriptional regulator [Actinocrinis sp.]HEV2345011.1 TetR family transcriptional regulator [Actinocrinis sp.]